MSAPGFPFLPPSRFFPAPELADEDGIVAIGGTLHPQLLLDAYSHGIFPWPVDPRTPIVWASPKKRAIFDWGKIHIPRRLKPIIRRKMFQISINQDFRAVITGCANAPGRRGQTWLTPAMIKAYTQFHDLGFAHSVEVRQNGTLVGGVYGVAIAGLFAAESMFYRVSNASKVGLLYLLAHLRQRGYTLVDIQMLTPVTESLGAIEISRAEYLRRLAAALKDPITFSEELTVGPEEVLALDSVEHGRG
ncbi:MAG: leucyl/phenylalanyl-tRNA--protein transferase [Thermogutta sp.]